ncbi:DUF4192 family protein [Microbacterium sp. RG1]|uniref:DUF4192 family protein n=1 Tax=Microbacterium sp. RG1 TaxID=2489212 RepID=UPI0010CA4A5A|nr:DUF4192 family protein [Microbacterium sp. RG1]QCQ17231.1 DUF4192 family protein [Microbacterium sp. RG1]
MTTIIKARDAADFLSLVPRLLGYEPRHSVVLIPFSAGRTGGGLRVDLPPAAADTDAVASTLIGFACRVEHTDAYAVLVYDDADTPTHAELVAALEIRAQACGLRRIDALHISSGRWRSYLDPALGGEIAADPDAGAHRPDGDQGAGASLPHVDLARSERVGRALTECARALEWVLNGSRPADARIHPDALVASLALEDLPAFFETWLTPRGPVPPGDAAGAERADVQDLALLIWCLARPALRDIALATWVRGVDGGDAALIAQQEWEAGVAYPDELGAWMMGEGARPDVDRLTGALEVCRLAASSAPAACRPGALAAGAWLSWALGRSTHAARYCEQALAIDAEHGLSLIVLSMVDAGHLPDWAFRAQPG